MRGIVRGVVGAAEDKDPIRCRVVVAQENPNKRGILVFSVKPLPGQPIGRLGLGVQLTKNRRVERR